MAEPDPSCTDCLGITLTQRECPNCGGDTLEGELQSGPGAAGGDEDSDSVHGWHCPTCSLLWDGGERYGFACLTHGGHEPKAFEGHMLTPGSPIGRYSGSN